MGLIVMPIERKFTQTHVNVLVSNETLEPALSNECIGSPYILLDDGLIEF